MEEVTTPSPPPRRQPAGGPPRRTLRFAALFICLLLVAVAVLSAVGITTELLAPMTSNKAAPSILMNIPAGANARQIGALLARRHLVRHASGFVLAVRIAGLSGKMKAGRYELSPAMPPRQIAALIALGKVATDWVTIPEGYTTAQIARRLSDSHMGDEATFLLLARAQGQTFVMNGFRPPNPSLEGYLFPDTYRIPKGETERAIIAQMLANFQKRVLVPNRAAIARYPGGLPALITMASLVEREAKVDRDRPEIAAALTNRLKQGMRLECDATIEYALPAYKKRLFYSDLKLDSPYNTYLHTGLPPTPIANPGLPSIEAALHPAKVNYLYYVARPDGSHIFSSTLAAHDHAVAQVRSARR